MRKIEIGKPLHCVELVTGESLTGTVLISEDELRADIYSYTGQSEMNFYTLESQADIRLGKWFAVGGGLRYNRVISGDIYWGGRLMAMVTAGRLGGLQVQYEKSHLPTIHKTLYGIETGRVSWFKNF